MPRTEFFYFQTITLLNFTFSHVCEINVYRFFAYVLKVIFTYSLYVCFCPSLFRACVCVGVRVTKRWVASNTMCILVSFVYLVSTVPPTCACVVRIKSKPFTPAHVQANPAVKQGGVNTHNCLAYTG